MSIENSINEVVKDLVEKAVKARFDKLSSDNYSLQTRLDWTEKKLNEALEKLSTRNNDLFDNEVSGDKIDGGTITTFSSTGIKDDASAQKVTIADDIHDAFKIAENLRKKEGRFFIHPFEGSFER